MDLASFIAISSVPVNLAALSTKMIYSKIDDAKEIKDIALNEGLYHVTSEENCDKILESGYLKPSNNLISLGRRKTFFFAVAPDYDTLMQNVGSTNTYEFSALRVKMNEEQLKNYRVRKYSDNAVVCDGKCELKDKQVQKVAMVLDIDEKGNIFTREKSDDEEYTPKQELVDKLNLKPTRMQALKNMFTQAIKLYGKTFSNLRRLGSDTLKKITNKKEETKLLPEAQVPKKEEWRDSIRYEIHTDLDKTQNPKEIETQIEKDNIEKER